MGERYEVRETEDRWMGKCWSVWDNREDRFTGGNFAYSLKAAADATAKSMNENG